MSVCRAWCSTMLSIAAIGLRSAELFAGSPPLDYTQAPHVFTQSPELFRSLLLQEHAAPTRIAFFGDSTSFDQNGSGSEHMNWRRWLWHLYHGHTPGTQLCRTTNFGNIPGGEFMFTGAALYYYGGVVPTSILPPGFNGNASMTFAREVTWVAGMHIQLNHENDNHLTQSCSWGPNGFYYVDEAINQGNIAYAVGTMQGGKSLIDVSAGLRVEVLAATHPESAPEVWWGLIPQQSHCNIDNYAPLRQEGVIFGGKQTLTGPLGGYLRAQTPPLLHLDGPDRYYRVIVSGNTPDSAHGVQIVGARFLSDDPTGLITDSFSQGGYTSTTVLSQHPGFGPALAAGGYTCAWLMYGINDEYYLVSPAVFKNNNLELINFIRSALGDPNIPIIVETSTYTVLSNAIGRQYAGVLYEIAQADPNVMFVNSRRVAEERFGWGTGMEKQYLSDGVHYTNAGGEAIARSSVETVIDYLDVKPVPCIGDVDGNRAVNIYDLLAVVAAWGTQGGPADVTGDKLVDINDLLAVIAAWGPCK